MGWRIHKVHTKSSHRMLASSDVVESTNKTQIEESNKLVVELNFNDPEFVSRRSLDSVVVQPMAKLVQLETRYTFWNETQISSRFIDNALDNFTFPEFNFKFKL